MEHPSRRDVRSVPPRGFTAEDQELLAGAQGIELAVRDLYAAAIAAGADSDVYVGIRDNHGAYVDLLSGLIGRSSRGTRNEALYEEQLSAFEGATGEELASAAYELESSLVSTHIGLLEQLAGIDGANAIASIIPIEARHTVVLADLAGQGDDLEALFTNDAEPLELPVEGRG